MAPPQRVKVLNVAEKPSVAREVTRLMTTSTPQKKHSNSKFNPVLAFPYQLKSKDCDMLFTSVAGHIMKIDFPPEYRDWNAVKPERLFSAPIIQDIDPNCENIAKNLKEYARGAHWLILWLDCDREGEAIAFEVMRICQQVNSNIVVYRAIFSSVTRVDVEHACNNLQEPKKSLSDAVEARTEMDLRIGASFTRLMSTRYRRKLELPSELISFGPCQFPTLGFLVERSLKIEAFVSEPFWAIEATLSVVQGNETAHILFSWDRHRLFDRLAVFILFERCVLQPEALVTNVTGKERSKRKPVPLSTVEMNKAATKWLSLTSHRCMQVAESLYNRGFISYPRTETEVFSQTMDLQQLIRAHTDSALWGSYAQSLLDGKFRWPRDGRGDDKAHPPIHPVRCCNREECPSEEEWKLYEFICRHFLACCSDDAYGFESRVDINISDEAFHANGLIVIERNWLDVYPFEKWMGRQLPKFFVNDLLTPTSIQMKEGKTEPPSPLTEADLLEKMNKNGIGTDATMHEHIHTIEERKYAWKDGNARLLPTPLGTALVKGYKQIAHNVGMDLSKPALRAQMEADMAAIAQGSKLKEAVVSSHIAAVSRVFRIVCENICLLDVELQRYFPPMGNTVARNGRTITDGISRCGRCQGHMDIRSSRSSSAHNALGIGEDENADDGSIKKRVGRAKDRYKTQDTPPAVENRFLVCKNYTNGCSTILHLPYKGDLSANANMCPYCQFQVLNVYNPQTAKTHTICPYCFRNPPVEDVLDAPSVEELAEFRCFMCRHRSCPLAINRNRR